MLTINASTKIDDNKEAMDADNARVCSMTGTLEDAPVMDSDVVLPQSVCFL
jgi:hypothetical protein